MMTNAVDFIAPGASIGELTGTRADASSGSFASWLTRELQSVNQTIQVADTQVQQLATGEQDNLHQVMLGLEKAKLGFELVVEVRNKLLEGYQEIIRMQV
jgi:flagellar hook-basal body complex protein FliE